MREDAIKLTTIIAKNRFAKLMQELKLRIERVQAKKSTRGMPGHQKPKKDATSCDKLRGGANSRNIRRFPNWETTYG